jgi:hypothetical protein
MDKSRDAPESVDPPTPASQADPAVTGEEKSGDIWSGRNGWIGGAVLIVLGVLFLLRNFDLFDLDNWWALFILIPAVGAFATAWRTYQRSGRWSSAARGQVIGGLVFTLVALAFLFNLDFGSIWPLFLILGGVSLLVNALLPE